MDESLARAVPALRPPLLGWLPVIAWAGLIFAFSAQPNLRFLPDQGLDYVVRKIGHAGVFGILPLLSWRALTRTTPRAGRGPGRSPAPLIGGRRRNRCHWGADRRRGHS